MRQTVGKRQEDKVLRKITRRTARDLLAENKEKSVVLSMLGGVGGVSKHLVTLEPRKRRALPFSFNSTLRAVRQEAELEDDTDSEEEYDGSARLNEKGEVALGEPTPTGAVTAGGRAIIREIGGRGGEEEDMEGEEGEEDEEEVPVVEQSGRKKAGDKPVGKREMSDSYYAWANKDLINPSVAGFYSSDVPAGKRAKARAARKEKRGQTGKKSTFIPFVRQ
jgi:hypothetical protein